MGKFSQNELFHLTEMLMQNASKVVMEKLVEGGDIAEDATPKTVAEIFLQAGEEIFFPSLVIAIGILRSKTDFIKEVEKEMVVKGIVREDGRYDHNAKDDLPVDPSVFLDGLLKLGKR